MALEREVMGGHNVSKKVLIFFSGSNQLAFAFNISSKIKSIREKLDEIVKDSSEFAFVLRPREEGRFIRPLGNQTHSFVDVEEVIGQDDDRDAVIDILTASCATQEKRLSVIPIVGLGGIGKTTFTQLLYSDERVEKHFDLKLWVCVSEVFDVKEVIKKIIMSATKSESPNLEMDQLKSQLRKEIGGKKYLLVLDDVWNENREEWLNLSSILKVGGEGSKILVSTRSKKVADIMGTVPAYALQGLSEEMSWALFEKLAFEPGESQKKPQLVKLGKEIVKKCAGVPLALRSLGSFLYGYDEWKWIAIAGTSFAKLPNKQNNILAILKLSYHQLLSPLKNCFAYCALFPKDYKFERETLIALWMAEGFIVPTIVAQILEELGYEYLVLLWQKGFFQDITRDEYGEISSFKMHDLMHDLALEVAGTESKVAKFQDGNFSDQIHHLSLGYQLTNSWKFPGCMRKAKHLRSFLLLEQFRDGSYFNKAVLQQLISNFRCLRVLDLRNLGSRTLLKSICKLIHLRYLNLSVNPIQELPNSIIRLQNLQTLILHNLGLRTLPKSIGKLIHLRYLILSLNRIEKLPNSITKLQNLRTLNLHLCSHLRALPIHTRKLTNLRILDVRGCYKLTHMPPGLGELSFLHKLPCFIVKCSSSPRFVPNFATNTSAHLGDLKTLNNLRGSLQIELSKDLKDPAFEAKEANLNIKHGLNELIIISGVDSYVEVSPQTSLHDEVLLEGLKPHQNLKKLKLVRYRGQKLPSWAMTDNLCMTLPNLVQIHFHCFQNCRQVPSFSQLPFLRCLALGSLESVEYMEMSPHGIQSSPSRQTFFPSLQELDLRCMENLKGWWDETEVKDCIDKEKISLKQSHLCPPSLLFSNLELLHIEDCPNLATLPLCTNVRQVILNKFNKQLNVLKKLSSSTMYSDAGSSATIPECRSRLKSLSVDDVDYLISLPEEHLGHITSLAIQDSNLLNTCRLKEVFKQLSSLTHLKFSMCESLTLVSEGLEHLTLLNSLSFQDCGELDLSQNKGLEDGMPWKALNRLRFLLFHNIPKLVYLPCGLQHLTKLRSLHISENDNLAELPQWISCFSSLKSMQLYDCPKLTCLPEEFGKLSTLNELEILKCHGLTKRCRCPTGSDWPKIQHIPLLSVKERRYW